MKIVVFLQNAWARNAHDAAFMKRNRRVWLYAAAGCRSGGRLRVMLGEDCFQCESIEFENTTPEVGIGSAAKLPPDRQHVRRLLDTHAPEVVIACGEQAAGVLTELWDGPLLIVPHPASRLLTNELLRAAGELVAAGAVGRKRMRQLRGGFVVEGILERVAT